MLLGASDLLHAECSCGRAEAKTEDEELRHKHSVAVPNATSEVIAVRKRSNKCKACILWISDLLNYHM